MEILMKFLKGTPIWVYIIFIYFLIQGLSALKPRQISSKRIFILPIVLTLMSLSSASKVFFSLWIPAAAIGGWLGWRWMRNFPVIINVKNKEIQLPGSSFPLIFFLSIFAIKYSFGALHAIHPETYLKWAPYQALFSGLLLGLGWGRSLTIWKIYQKELKNT